jgi:4-amino-4-deoxy-L-arabinose transferase-like glycosyltransferase
MRLFNVFPDMFDLNVAWGEPMLPWITGLIYLARYTSVATGVLATLMVYQLGRRAYSRGTGVGAAIIFGLTFLPAREAHFAVSDAPVALAVAVVLYLCLRIIERGDWLDYLLTGLALGLATATKYSAGLLVLPFGVAHLLSRKYGSWPERLTSMWLVVVAGLVAVVGFLVTSPYTLLKRRDFWADFSENLMSAKIGFQGLDLDPAGGAIFYLKGLIWGFGWPLFILFLVSVVFALWRRRRADIMLLTLPLFGFFYMQRQEMYFVRWLTPLLPPMAVLAAEIIHAGIGQITRVWPNKRANARIRQHYSLFIVHCSSLIIIALLTLPSTYMALRANHVFSQLDTRTEALNWIRQNIPPGSSLAAELLSPPWGPPLALPGLEIGPYNFAPVPDGGVAELDLKQYRA